MSDLITDAMVEAAAKLLDPDAWEMSAGVYQDTHGRSYGNSESFIRSARTAARQEARRILRVAAPTIAAKALRDAAIFPGSQLSYAAREWLRARADRIEEGES